ncbi:hypothetical protein CLV35_0552 [Motilibacter peucedani]|uniref:Flagellar FliJ protein n=1 Tax=Motilibacter peucedani TaxID=598650 RepID=A0A420XTR9_9ACTN|nr:hypothetical protein [Motilibacter peucedani]RKS80131.1 hypothetical protein CLV35_0552 [Motilibacter peucedani]
MARRSPLATLLRVRRIQEDIARAEVVTARALAVLAEENAAAREAAATRSGPVDGDPRTFVASLVAGRSYAADAFAARRRAVEARATVDTRLAVWSEAAGRAEGVDRVVTRHETEARAAEEAADAAERDDLASVARRRRAAAEQDPS